ncbi:hypothetical protein NA78x_003067 [Anatilimnocola sp. NA78]
MMGLPGGSSGEGPASWAGLLLVVTVAGIVIGGLVYLLFQITPV